MLLLVGQQMKKTMVLDSVHWWRRRQKVNTNIQSYTCRDDLPAGTSLALVPEMEPSTLICLSQIQKTHILDGSLYNYAQLKEDDETQFTVDWTYSHHHSSSSFNFNINNISRWYLNNTMSESWRRHLDEWSWPSSRWRLGWSIVEEVLCLRMCFRCDL